MADNTTNYGLVKPAGSEKVDIAVINGNMDKIDAALAGKVDKVTGKGLSTNDFTDADKSKLDSLENYDDTDIKIEIAKTAEQSALNRSTLGYWRKNLLLNKCQNITKNGVTASVNNDGSITLNGHNTSGNDILLYQNMSTGNADNQYDNNQKFLPNGKYIVSGGVSDCSIQVCSSINNSSASVSALAVSFGDDVPFSVGDDNKYVWFRVYVSKTADFSTPVTIHPMIRPAEITDDTYEPYKPSVEERLNDITDQIFGLGENIPSGADLNDYTQAGVYYAENSTKAETLLNNPHKGTGFRLEVCYQINKQRFIQKLLPNTSMSGIYYHRVYASQGFGSWYKFTGEAVTT